MSITRAKDLIAVIQALKDEYPVEKAEGMRFLTSSICSTPSLPEPQLKYIFNTRERLRNYDERGIPYVFFYRKKDQSLRVYTIQ